MSQYGELLGEYEPEKDSVYMIFTDFYNNPGMTKTQETKTQSVYMTRIHSLLSNTYKYLIAMVPKDSSSLGVEKDMVNLKWNVFQTRSMKDKRKLKPHHYMPARGTALDAKITRTEETKESSTYSVNNLPIKITLLNTADMSHDYHANGSVLSALETFQTVVTFTQSKKIF
jgi:hypothetical protein